MFGIEGVSFVAVTVIWNVDWYRLERNLVVSANASQPGEDKNKMAPLTIWFHHGTILNVGPFCVWAQ